MVTKYWSTYYKKHKKQVLSKNKIYYKTHFKIRQQVERRSNLKRMYGITVEFYNSLLHKQNKLCAICGQRNRYNRRLHIDHDHKTGLVRGLLCHGCNTSLGGFKEDTKILQRAIQYLKGEE